MTVTVSRSQSRSRSRPRYIYFSNVSWRNMTPSHVRVHVRQGPSESLSKCQCMYANMLPQKSLFWLLNTYHAMAVLCSFATKALQTWRWRAKARSRSHSHGHGHTVTVSAFERSLSHSPGICICSKKRGKWNIKRETLHQSGYRHGFMSCWTVLHRLGVPSRRQ